MSESNDMNGPSESSPDPSPARSADAFDEDVMVVTTVRERVTLARDDVLPFGRTADLVLDPDNPRLHRIAGRFVHVPGVGWTLENRCRAAAMVVTDHASASFARVVPGGTMPLPFAEAAVTFCVGGVDYRLDVHRPDAPARRDVTMPETVPGEITRTFACPPLNADQAALLRLLVAPRLRGPITAADLPSNRVLAERLGWSQTKLNRKLDRLCEKFDRAGHAGLVPNEEGMARERRLRLVDCIVENGWLDALVTTATEG